MTEMKLNLEAIRVNMGLERAEMAEKLGISLDRYNRLAIGDSKMLAVELVKLIQVSGIPWEHIKIDQAA